MLQRGAVSYTHLDVYKRQLYPYELVTYGESGQVCQNWMQYRLIKKYLEVMTDEQTLVVMSGHPLGLFHSHKLAPRCIISNGLMIGMYDDQKNFNRAAALDRKSTRLNSSHSGESRMPSSA